MSKKSSKGSKNDITNRGGRSSLRKHNGRSVKPVLFYDQNGRKCMVGRYEDSSQSEGVIVDANGVPIPYSRFMEQK